MWPIYFQIGVIACLVLVLGLVAYDDWRTTKLRRAEDEEKRKQEQEMLQHEVE